MSPAQPASRYVQITRHLYDPADDPPSPFTRRARRSGSGKPPETWKDVLLPWAGDSAADALVLVAPSTAGKSTEIRQQAIHLTVEGHFAFCTTARAVARQGLRNALNGPDQAAFDEWARSQRPAVIFVDAVDELILDSVTFEDVTLRLSHEVDFAHRPVQLVITARVGAWTSRERLALIRLIGKGEKLSIAERTLEPLGTAEIGAVARILGVLDAESFDDAFRDGEFEDLLDLYPLNVRIFVNYWNAYRRLGTWTDMLRLFVDAAAAEHNPLHAGALSVAEIRDALARIAVACLTMNTNLVAFSGPVPGAIDGRRLFANLPEEKYRELASRGVFGHKDEDVLQLPPGPLAHFLAAEWFAERVRRGRNVEELLDDLAVSLYGGEEAQIPDSRAAVVGWIASSVPDLRKRLAEIAPRVLLFEGDPSRLTSPDIENGLRRLCSDIAAGKYDPWPSRATVRWLAVPSLESTVLQLLETFRGSPLVEQHLLRFAHRGRYRAGLKPALELALDDKSSAVTRIDSIGFVGAVGDAAHQENLRPLLTDQDHGIRLAVLKALVPRLLDGKPLVDALLSLDQKHVRYASYSLQQSLSVNDIDATLTAVEPELASTSETETTAAHHALGFSLLLERLKRVCPEPMPAWLPGLVVGLESHADHQFISTKQREELRALLDELPFLRRAVWEARLRASDGGRTYRYRANGLSELVVEDINWLHDLATDDSRDADRRKAAHDEIQRVWQWAPAGDRLAFRDSGRAAAPIVARLAELDLHAARFEEQGRAAEASGREQETAELRRQTQGLKERLVAISEGLDMGGLYWAWERGFAGGGYGRVDASQLAQDLDPALASAFSSGFKACWRKQEPQLFYNGGTPVAVLIGLTGLTLAFSEDLSPKDLTSQEALQAAIYGLHELSGFPSWYERLLVAHRPEVTRVLIESVGAEWKANPVRTSGVIGWAPYASPEIARVIGDAVLELVEHERVPTALLRGVGNALFFASGDHARVVRAAARLLDDSDSLEPSDVADRLRIWAHVDSSGAAAWLRALGAQSVVRFRQVVMETAARLERDFDREVLVGKSRLLTPESLAVLLPLIFEGVNLSEDLHGEGRTTPTSRDEAERFRGRCMRALVTNPTAEARRVLRELGSEPALAQHQLWLARQGEQQLGHAAEFGARRWTEDDVLAVERGDERQPETLAALFTLVGRHLIRVNGILENADFSYRRLFTSDTPEKLLQLWVAANLELVSRGLYSIDREGEVQDNNKPDIGALISLSTGSMAGQIRLPIEIKPAGGRSPRDLQDAISLQLHDQYMRPPTVTHGILVVIRNDREQRWKIDGRLQGFDALMAQLRSYARTFGAQRGRTIAVHCIDVVGDSD